MSTSESFMRVRALAGAILFSLLVTLVGTSATSQAVDEDLERALERALQGTYGELRIDAECLDDDVGRSVRLSGNGTLVWNRAKQSRVPEETLKAQLAAFRDFGFAAMEKQYGGKGDPARGSQAPRIVCRVMLRIDGAAKEVIQYQGGRQSEELLKLAARLFELARPFGESGIEALDLRDGLAKIASGALAPETLVVTVQRRTASDGWLLRVEGLEATVRSFRPEAGFGDAITLGLAPEELQELSRRLRELDPEELPANLYAEHYTDLSLGVLNREKQVQARAFGRLTPTSLGERQEHFDAILGELTRLRQRVLDEGRSPQL